MLKAHRGLALAKDSATARLALQRECRSSTVCQRFLDDAGHFSCAGSRCNRLSFSRWFQRLQLHLFGQLRFRLSGSEALCCKTMRLISAMRVLTGRGTSAAPDAMAGCSETWWVVVCTWAACSSLCHLQYCARTSAHTSTCRQSDSLVMGILSHVKDSPDVLSFRCFETYRCTCGVFAADTGTAAPAASMRRACGGFLFLRSRGSIKDRRQLGDHRDVCHLGHVTMGPITFGRMIWAECRSDAEIQAFGGQKYPSTPHL